MTRLRLRSRFLTSTSVPGLFALSMVTTVTSSLLSLAMVICGGLHLSSNVSYSMRTPLRVASCPAEASESL